MYDFNGTSDYFRATTAVVTAAPLTMACFFNADSQTATGALISINDTAANSGFMLFAAGASAGDPVAFNTHQAGTAASAVSATGYTAGTIHHAAGVTSGAASRFAYIDGVAGTEQTSSVTPTSLDDTYIAARNNAGAFTFFDGKVAEVGIWNVALTAAEIAALAKGLSPMLVRPSALVFYPPLIRNQVNRKGTALSIGGGTPTAGIAHPRMVYPRMHRQTQYGTAPAVSNYVGLGLTRSVLLERRRLAA